MYKSTNKPILFVTLIAKKFPTLFLLIASYHFIFLCNFPDERRYGRSEPGATIQAFEWQLLTPQKLDSLTAKQRIATEHCVLAKQGMRVP